MAVTSLGSDTPLEDLTSDCRVQVGESCALHASNSEGEQEQHHAQHSRGEKTSEHSSASAVGPEAITSSLCPLSPCIKAVWWLNIYLMSSQG